MTRRQPEAPKAARYPRGYNAGYAHANTTPAMTLPDAGNRRVAKLHRIEQVRRLLAEEARRLPPGDWLRLAIERALAEEAEREDAPGDANR